jgi:hypothetical protein
MKPLPLALLSMLLASVPPALAQVAPHHPSLAELGMPPRPLSRSVARTVRELESVLAKRPAKVIVTDNAVVPEFVEDLVILSNDLATRYRGGMKVGDHGTVYFHNDVMYQPAREIKLLPKKTTLQYGVASVGHSTGPAARLKW